MADTRGLYTIDAAGTATLVRNLEDGTSYFAQRDSFNIKAAPRNQVQAKDLRRYGGSRVVDESHDNATAAWTMTILGTSADNTIAKLETLLGDLEAARTDLYLGWTPEGATKQIFYHVRGPATFTPTYKNRAYAGSLLWEVGVEIPVAPLGRQAAPVTNTISSTTLPATIALSSAITGDAPAPADISLRFSGGSNAPVWALIAWIKRITASPIGGTVAPWGIIEAESYTTVSTWAKSLSDATYRGSDGIRTTTSGAGTAAAAWLVDPSVMQPDDWTRTIAIEVWARVELAATVVSPKLTLGLLPTAGANFGSTRYPPVYGSAGKQLVSPSSGTRFRFVRLGVLTMPVDPATPVSWSLQLGASWAAGSSGSFGVDYLCLVPAKSRVLMPTGKVLDANYPKFIRSTSDTTRTVKSDLSGLTASAAGNGAADSGMTGSRIWLPPGNVDLLVKPSSLVPDDPTSDTTSEQLSHTGVTGSVVAIPYFWHAAQ